MLTLAAANPIADITISAICREAGVTRDTFYRHADSPLALLADALAEDLVHVVEVLPRAHAMGDAERALLRHVQDRAEVYRGTMHPSLAAPVRANLEGAIRSGLELWAELHPDILPAVFRTDATALRIAIAYAASGTVGAIEAWLRQEDTDIDRAVELILAASPEWWLATPAAAERRRQ